MTQQTWTPAARRRPVVLAGGSQFLKDQVARACAAAGVTALLVPGAAEALALDPVVLLVSHEQAAAVSGRREVVVVGSDDDGSRAWGAASGLPASRVVILPQGSGWLAEHLGRRLNPAATGSIIGFLGSAGGAGVSTLACWCARLASARGYASLLVDGGPLGGGLDLAVGIEERPGVRWHDLGSIRGTLGAEQFAAALPSIGSLSVLSHAARHDGADDAAAETMGSAGIVMDAARGAFDHSFLDLGCGGGVARQLLTACDRLVLVVPARPRSVAATAQILQANAAVPTTVVLRGPVLDGLDKWLVADLLGRPGPLACLPFVRGVARAEADGRLLDFPLPRAARRVVASILSADRVSA